MRIPEQKILPAIDAIYRAGLDPNAWQDVVDHMQKLLPMTCVALHGYQGGDPPAVISVTGGWDPGIKQQFLTEWAAQNPYPALIPQMQVGVPVIAEESEFIATVRQTDFYRFQLDIDFGAAVGIPLWNTPERTCFLVFDYSVRQAAKINKSVARVASIIAPHLARSFETSHRLARAYDGTAQLASLLTRINGPALIVDHRRRVRFANRAGEMLLRSGGAIKIDQDRGVALADAAAAAGLAQALRACFDPALAAAPCAVSFTTREGNPRLLNVVPVVADDSVGKGPLGRFLGERERLALLIVSTPWDTDADAASRLRDALTLTPAEVKLALALMQGSSLHSYARSRGIALNTVRNQLRSLFEKSQTHRQAELVATLFSELRRSASL